MSGHPDQEKKEFAEAADSLWRLVFGPIVWAVHFLVSYAAAAVYCAKFGTDAGSILGFRIAVGGAGVVALAVLAWLGWAAWRQWDYMDDKDYVHDRGREEDRHEFLGHAALLLVIVSTVGVLYSMLPVTVLGSCR